MPRRAWGLAWIAPVALVVAACGSTTQNDELYPACNGISPAGLASESTSKGTCPSSPTTLTGKATVGAVCGSAADCKPYCCSCTNGTSALVAQCSNGSCLDGNDTCCLFSQQCGN
jgi:hypothetical protein